MMCYIFDEATGSMMYKYVENPVDEIKTEEGKTWFHEKVVERSLQDRVDIQIDYAEFANLKFSEAGVDE